MFAHAIAQVEPPDVGIHLIWSGPHPWVYSLEGGWAIQRRPARPPRPTTCDELIPSHLDKLRSEFERVSPLGLFTLRQGLWPVPIASTSGVPPSPCEVLTLKLTVARRRVEIRIEAKDWFILGLRGGKVVAVQRNDGQHTFILPALFIDTVIAYVIELSTFRCCVNTPGENDDSAWDEVPFIVKDLQLPLGELMPLLDTPEKEFAEAKSRLLPGESLDPEEFRRLTSSLRLGVRQALQSRPPRPLDQVLLMREDPTADYEELSALDPIRVLLSHPKWRRVLGFGWFDKDPSLQQGESYEYRITGHFPVQDLIDRVYGFHSTPSQTALPADFMLRDIRLRLPEPVVVQRAPGTEAEGTIQITRRGIPIQPRQNQSWVLIPSLEDNSLVIDFPSPITSVIFELHKEHQFTYTAHAMFGLAVIGPNALPPGIEPRLTFPFPIKQIRLEGTGFLFAIRIPFGFEGIKPIPVVLPPVVLENTPRPAPPVKATISNLQQIQPPPIPSNTPPSNPPTRPALGFEVMWRPALRDGIAVWPPDAGAAPPLDAALFQIEHREEQLLTLDLPDTFFTGELSATTRTSEAKPRLNAELLAAVGKARLKREHRESLIRALAAGDTETVHSLLLVSASPWTPVLPEENLTLGDRNRSTETEQIRIQPGVNVMSVFPEVAAPGTSESLDLVWDDVFDFEEDGGPPVNRPLPSPGTHHRYRVRAVDAIGRPSPSWTETNVLRLEKHVPPPVPVGPDQTPADLLPAPRPTGVQAKVIVRDGPGLTPDDVALLGNDDNVVVLRWGWHENQREQDPLATEFRIYATNKPLDVVRGTLTSVSEFDVGIYIVTIQLERSVVADAAKSGPLEAGYPFVIHSHTAGQTITATVGTRVADANGNLRVPVLGPVRLHTHLTPNLTRPPAWTNRAEVQPITAATEYRSVFRNLLTLTADHPKDSIWVGVSSADDQFYVPDQLAPVDNRTGNESAIVPVLCEGRYHGRPNFSIPPALDPVPVFITPEPTDRAIQFALDLTPFLSSTGLSSSNRIRPERVSAAAVFRAYRATTTGQIFARAIDPRDGETDVEVIVPNPDDRQSVLDALNGANVDALEDRFVVFLAGSHAYPDRLFEPVIREVVPFARFQETLPPLGERYVYRVRLSDAAGHLSAGGAMAAVVVRVPTMTPGASPSLVPGGVTDIPGLVRIRIGPDPSLTHLLIFQQLATNGDRSGAGASVLRIPNLADAYPEVGIQLRAPDGTLLAPQLKSLADPDVVVDPDGFRNITLAFLAGLSEKLHVWACTVSRDGVPSILAGPCELPMPPARLPTPTLAATRVGADVIFAWTWPAGDHSALEVALEHSRDGFLWHRFTPMLGDSVGSYVYTPTAPDNLTFRIVVTNSAGRKAFGEPVVPS